MYSIEASQLSHKFNGGETVLDEVNLAVREGSIYGFLGPNGAGKTTTLRLILGLLQKQRGDILLFGRTFHQHRTELLLKIGSLIESPSLYGHLTATENLRICQKIYQCPTARIPEVLRLTGLSDTGNKKASRFSLGMKQRLGIAVALLHSPTLLILDEPTNGLDPAGIIEIRELLKNLNKESGTTILISSHLLAEIEKLVTDVGIIHQGKMRFQGTLEELMSLQKNASFIAFETNNNTATFEFIQTINPNALHDESKVMLPAISKMEIAAIARQLIHQGIDIYSITPQENDLESIFMNLTSIQKQ